MLDPVRDLFRAALDRLNAPPVIEPNTAGGQAVDDDAPEWDGGRYRGARWAQIHPGRDGGAIKPWGVVVHTTDMHPSTFDALVRAWQRGAGRGAGAHFLIGRTPAEGIVQMVDVGRNSNHAGGQTHGWFESGGEHIHPNLVTVGIEVHAAGGVRKVDAQWRCWSDGKPVGTPLPASEVQQDPKRELRGWHVPNAYQLAELERLLDALAQCPLVVRSPAALTIKPNGTAPAWAPRLDWMGLTVVGHVTLDPNDKSDPGPMLSAWLRSRGG